MNISDFLDQIKRSLAIVKKDLYIYYAKGPVVIFGLLLPAFTFISFSLGKDFSAEFLFPGLLAMSLFFTSTSIGPAIAPTETATKTLERLVSAPIAVWAILFGDIFASFLFGLFITSFVLIFGSLLLGIEVITVILIAATVLASFCFSAFGLVLSAPPTDKPSNIMMLSSLIKFPLTFISGVFVPLNQMPLKIRFISFISPLTYYTDIARYSIEGNSYFPPTLNLLVLFGYTLLLFTIAIIWQKKSLTKRF